MIAMQMGRLRFGLRHAFVFVIVVAILMGVAARFYSHSLLSTARSSYEEVYVSYTSDTASPIDVCTSALRLLQLELHTQQSEPTAALVEYLNRINGLIKDGEAMLARGGVFDEAARPSYIARLDEIRGYREKGITELRSAGYVDQAEKIVILIAFVKAEASSDRSSVMH